MIPICPKPNSKCNARTNFEYWASCCQASLIILVTFHQFQNTYNLTWSFSKSLERHDALPEPSKEKNCQFVEKCTVLKYMYVCTRHAAADNYRDIHFFLLGLHNNKRSELIPFCHSQSYSNKVLALALFYKTEYRGFLAYANFISAYFITAILQNISEIFR